LKNYKKHPIFGVKEVILPLKKKRKFLVKNNKITRFGWKLINTKRKVRT